MCDELFPQKTEQEKLQKVGYCCEDEHRLLVYEYMAHGSLAD
jgi:hypothetical protein